MLKPDMSIKALFGSTKLGSTQTEEQDVLDGLQGNLGL